MNTHVGYHGHASQRDRDLEGRLWVTHSSLLTGIDLYYATIWPRKLSTLNTGLSWILWNILKRNLRLKLQNLYLQSILLVSKYFYIGYISDSTICIFLLYKILDFDGSGDYDDYPESEPPCVGLCFLLKLRGEQPPAPILTRPCVGKCQHRRELGITAPPVRRRRKPCVGLCFITKKRAEERRKKKAEEKKKKEKKEKFEADLEWTKFIPNISDVNRNKYD